MLIVYHLISLRIVRKLSNIHYQYRFLQKESSQEHLKYFSYKRYFELVHNNHPDDTGLKYLIAKATTSRIGDCVFGNYSRYRYCGYLVDIKNQSPEYHLSKLPTSYKKLFYEIYD